MLKILLAVGVLSSFSIAADANCSRIRAAFDIGSATTKMKVFKINICTQKIEPDGQIYPSLDSNGKVDENEDNASRAALGFSKDLNASMKDASIDPSDKPRFGQPLIEQAKTAFADLKKKASRFGATDFIGVATEAFRKSKNSDVLIDYLNDDLGIKVIVPSQDDEALIEWMGGAAYAAEGSGFPSKNLVSFGIGGGSMQIGVKLKNGNFKAFKSTLASDNMYAASRAALNRPDGVPLLPISEDEKTTLINIAKNEGNKSPSDVTDRITDMGMEVNGVGGVINKTLSLALQTMNIKRKFFTETDVSNALEQYVNKRGDDPIFGKNNQYADQVPSNLALIVGIMESLGITKVYFSPVDNTYAAPFMKEFTIKSVVERHQSLRPKATVVVQNNGNAPVQVQQPIPAPVAKVVRNNTDVCDGYGGKTANGVCTITEACAPVRNLCSSSSTTECVILGSPVLKFTQGVCP